MRFLAGRAFTDAEVAGRSPVAIVNASAARRFWPDRDPAGVVGRELTLSESASSQVVGVVPDIRTPGQLEVLPAVSVPIGEGTGLYGGEVVMRAATGRPPAIVALRNRLRERLGPAVAVSVTRVAPRFGSR